MHAPQEHNMHTTCAYRVACMYTHNMFSHPTFLGVHLARKKTERCSPPHKIFKSILAHPRIPGAPKKG
eukprot:10617344-Alexandrium_andersonii.AAC.1